jgi:hypothetical protein
MFKRRLLLITLFTGMALTGLWAQNQVHIHGNVTDSNGAALDSINILISVLYSDSSFVYESLYTDVDGHYETNLAGPPPNLFGTVQVSMVDCFGNLNTQWFTIGNGINDFQADFVYC